MFTIDLKIKILSKQKIQQFKDMNFFFGVCNVPSRLVIYLKVNAMYAECP